MPTHKKRTGTTDQQFIKNCDHSRIRRLHVRRLKSAFRDEFPTKDHIIQNKECFEHVGDIKKMAETMPFTKLLNLVMKNTKDEMQKKVFEDYRSKKQTKMKSVLEAYGGRTEGEIRELWTSTRKVKKQPAEQTPAKETPPKKDAKKNAVNMQMKRKAAVKTVPKKAGTSKLSEIAPVLKCTLANWTLSGLFKKTKHNTINGMWEYDANTGILKLDGCYDTYPMIFRAGIESLANPKAGDMSMFSEAQDITRYADLYNHLVNDDKIWLTKGNIGFDIQQLPSKDVRQMFLLPSQLNSAEYPNHTTIIKNIEKYCKDPTGGPRGQMAVNLGVADFLLKNASNMENIDGINNTRLMGTIPGVNLVNGYLQVQYNAEVDTFWKELHAMTVLGVRDIPVTNTINARNINDANPNQFDSTKKVDLVYASAVPIDGYCNDGPSRNVDDIAYATLVGQYSASLQFAIHNAKMYSKGKEYHVYLMPLGGGEFKNPVKNIKASIAFCVSKLKDELIKYNVKVNILMWVDGLHDKKLIPNSMHKKVVLTSKSYMLKSGDLVNVHRLVGEEHT